MEPDLYINCVMVGGIAVLVGELTEEGFEKAILNPTNTGQGLRQIKRHSGCYQLDMILGEGYDLYITGYTCVAETEAKVMAAARRFKTLAEVYLKYIVEIRPLGYVIAQSSAA